MARSPTPSRPKSPSVCAVRSSRPPAARAVEAAKRFRAGAIVAEGNQGGEMVRATLAQAGADCSIRLVHARHGKRACAEPVTALYEQGRVTHCAAFRALEAEL